MLEAGGLKRNRINSASFKSSATRILCIVEYDRKNLPLNNDRSLLKRVPLRTKNNQNILFSGNHRVFNSIIGVTNFQLLP